ncbi:unnamed protein product [Lactuca saligna]|uniref:Uncharacterized protein n=1 Tax=Lactuca saligna TaxID=75948 RepID=A0AA36EFH8_LACSI|nr:unnamed protein product [Lactuca saligna]
MLEASGGRAEIIVGSWASDPSDGGINISLSCLNSTIQVSIVFGKSQAPILQFFKPSPEVAAEGRDKDRSRSEPLVGSTKDPEAPSSLHCSVEGQSQL